MFNERNHLYSYSAPIINRDKKVALDMIEDLAKEGLLIIHVKKEKTHDLLDALKNKAVFLKELVVKIGDNNA